MNKKTLGISLLSIAALTAGVGVAIKTASSIQNKVAASTNHTIVFSFENKANFKSSTYYFETDQGNYVGLTSNDSYSFRDSYDAGLLVDKKAENNNFFVYNAFGRDDMVSINKIVSVAVDYEVTSPATKPEGDWWIDLNFYVDTYYGIANRIDNPVPGQAYTPADGDRYFDTEKYNVFQFALYGDMVAVVRSITIVYEC